MRTSSLMEAFARTDRTDADRRAGENQVADLQRDEMREVGYDPIDAEDHLRRIAPLP